MKRRELLRLSLAGMAASAGGANLLAAAGTRSGNARQGASELPFDRMAAHIVRALRPSKSERAILRYDPQLMPQLVAETKRQLEAAGVVVEPMAYSDAEEFAMKLAKTDIYVWLPAGPSAATPREQAAALIPWLDEGRGRQIHFHWADGTREADSTLGQHSAAYDRVYLDALELDYAALDRQMDAAIANLRRGEVRVTTPAGTDLRFRVGERPFCKQNGDASRERMRTARVRIDREIELPAGALRVAPLEESVAGRIWVPHARIGGDEARGIELVFEEGALTQINATQGSYAVRRYLASNAALHRFREFALGMNPKLGKPAGAKAIPYYGYGAGIVRLSLGDNQELGGAVRGGAVQWFFFPDATVIVGGSVILVKDGKLT